MISLEKHHVIEACLSAGACAARVARTAPSARDLEAHRSWLCEHLEPSLPGLSFLKKHACLKSDVRRFWPQAQSVVCVAVAFDCGPEGEARRREVFKNNGSSEKPEKLQGHLASYAQWADYHILVKGLLDGVGRLIKDRTQGQVNFRVCVDTDPLLEKGLARGCGLGWIGRNSCLIVPEIGSRVVLGELLLDHPLPPDEPLEGDPCKGCRICQEACPTDALNRAYTVDASRCLSYLTIEHPGKLSPREAQAMENRLFGCDTCLAVCPQNAVPLKPCTPTLASLTRKAGESAALRQALTAAPPSPMGPWVSLEELSKWGSRETKRRLRGTPLSRLSPALLRRNLCHLLGNLNTPAARKLLAIFLASTSPKVRNAALQSLKKKTRSAKP